MDPHEPLLDEDALNLLAAFSRPEPESVLDFATKDTVMIINARHEVRKPSKDGEPVRTKVARVKVARSDGDTLMICRSRQVALHYLYSKWEIYGRPAQKRERNRDLENELHNFVAVLPTDPGDAIFCQAGPSPSSDIAIVRVLKPVLVFYSTGLIELRYALYVVLDQQGRKLATNVHAYLARVLDDPALARPDEYQATCPEFLDMITADSSGAASPEIRPQPAGLLSLLLPYQQESVRFLLRREGKYLISQNKVAEFSLEVRNTEINGPLGWRRIPGTTHWLNPYSMRTSSSAPHRFSGPIFEGRGVLAEEMGLGKTVEIISLILLNPCIAIKKEKTSLHPSVKNESRELPELPEPVAPESAAFEPVVPVPTISEPAGLPSRNSVCSAPSEINKVPPLLNIKATLVVAPLIITKQWHEEIQKHAPSLVVVMLKEAADIAVNKFKDADVVIISYKLLASQLEPALFVPMKRPTRYNLGREVALSFVCDLVKVRFWRVVLDEAQMVHTGVSAAARVVKLIPRVHAWCVSGTPVSGTLEDLKGILNFLHLQPFVEDYAWRRLISSEVDFSAVLKPLCLRHTKALVADQLRLPKQNKKLLLMRFSKVEQWQYERILEEFRETKQPNLYVWFQALARACCNSRTQQPVGTTMGRTLNTLIKEQRSQLVANRRSRVNAIQLLGQLLDKADRMPEAIAAWKNLCSDIERYESSNNELAELPLDGSESETESDSEADEIEDTKHTRRNRGAPANSLKDLLHRTYFFLGTGYFRASQRMRLNSTPERLESQEVQKEMKHNSELERQFYKLAEDLRKNILKSEIDVVNDTIPQLVKHRLHFHGLTSKDSPAAVALAECNKILLNLEKGLLEMLTLPLIEEEVEETKPGVQSENDAYNKTLDAQEQAHVLLSDMQKRIKDRNVILYGGTIPLEYFNISIHIDIERTTPGLARIAAPSNAAQFREETTALQKRYAAFKISYNRRVEFYKKLQELSDKVADLDLTSIYEESTAGNTDKSGDVTKKERNRLSDSAIAELLSRKIESTRANISRITRALESSESRMRYLLGLQRDAGAEDLGSETKQAERICLVCQDYYKIGGLGPCGHIFCSDCFEEWVSSHRCCPLCKVVVRLEEIRRFNNDPTGTKEEQVSDARYIGHIRVPDGAAEDQKSTEIYSPVSAKICEEIGAMRLHETYGVKIDTIVKHAKYLRNHNPRAQIVVFSQWEQLLTSLHFVMNKSGVRTVGQRSNLAADINAFRESTYTACLLLHTRENVAGLTLINATHVFLCEPLLNTALELQAVSRVARIGQTRETTVWQFCVEDTIEQKILGYTTKKRLREMSQVGTDVADSAELEHAQSQKTMIDKHGVEIVDARTLREILLTRQNEHNFSREGSAAIESISVSAT